MATTFWLLSLLCSVGFVLEGREVTKLADDSGGSGNPWVTLGTVGQVASKNVGMGGDADGRLNAMNGPGYNKTIQYGGNQNFEVTVSDSIQHTSLVVTTSAVGDVTGIAGDGVPNLGAFTQELAGGEQKTTVSGYLSQTVAPGGEVLEKDYAGSQLDKTTGYTAEGFPTSSGVGPELMSISYGEDSRSVSGGGLNVTEGFYRVGLRKSVSGPNEARTFRYKRGELERETHTAGVWDDAIITWNQDGMGQCSEVNFSKPSTFSNKYGYGCDAAQRPSTVEVGNFTEASYIYHADGSLQQMDRSGVSSSSSQDALGRLITRSHTGVNGSVPANTYTYDERHRIVSTGAAALQNLLYDSEDRLLSATLSNGKTVSYSYDGRGNRLSGSGPAVAYSVNDNNQLTGRTVGPAGRGYGVSGRVAPGAQVKVFHPGAPQGEIVETHATTGVYEKWWGDPGAGVTRVELLVRGTKPGAGESGRDAVADQKVWVNLPLSSETYTYDGAGRLSEDGTWWYGWNALGQLTTLTRKATTAPDPNVATELITYGYDSDGRRTKRTRTVTYQDSSPTLTETSKVLWEKWHPVMEERTLNGAALPRRWFVWGRDVSGSIGGAGGIGGLVSIKEDGGRTLLPMDDGLGNIIAVVDASSRAVVARYDYGPFGEIVDESGEVGACPFRFQSKWWDVAAGLNYFGYRHYSPKMGRWLSRDPLGEAGGFNLYAYCGNDPVNKWDYLGMDTVLQDTRPNFFVHPDRPDLVVVTFPTSQRLRAPGMYRLTGNSVKAGVISRQRLAEMTHPSIPLRSTFDSYVSDLRQAANHSIELADGIASWEGAAGWIRLAPGGSAGVEIGEGNYGRGALYFGGDVALTLTGVKFLKSASGAALLLRSGAISGAGGLYTTAVEVGGERYDAWAGGYEYDRTWSDDGMALAINTGRSAAVGVVLPWVIKRLTSTKSSLIISEGESEYFYRSMSLKHYNEFLETGKVSASFETFISPTHTYSKGFEGVLVRFQLEAGTIDALKVIGRRVPGRRPAMLMPNIPPLKGSWVYRYALFKVEQGQINIGLGRGAALDIFNGRILGFEVMEVVK